MPPAPSGLPSVSLKHLFTLQCSVGTPLPVGDGGMGSERRVIPVTGGRFEGEISGECLNLGFDAILVQDDMTARPDAKYCLRTDQGEYILVHSEGVRYPPGKRGLKGAEARAQASAHHVSEYSFMLRLKLETGSPRLAYLNTAIVVGSAQRQDDSVRYDAYVLVQHHDDDAAAAARKDSRSKARRGKL